MRRTSWFSTGTIIAIAMATGAVAQETPPATEPAKQAEPEEEIIPVRWNEATLGYSSFRANAGLSQYARPSEGLSLHNLKWLSPATETRPYTRLLVRGTPNQDLLIDGYVTLNRGNTIVRGSRRQYSYYAFDWRPKEASDDVETEFSVDHAIAPNVGAFVSYRSSRRDGNYAAPRESDLARMTSLAGGVGGSLLGGNLGVTLTDRRTSYPNGLQPGTLQRTFAASYSKDFGDNLNLEGTADFTRIEQSGLPSSTIRTLALSGAWDLGPATGLQFHFGRQDLDLNTILNAHPRKRLVSSVRLMHRWPDWSLQFGVKHRETERVRADQSFVDVPKLNEYDARLAGKLGPARLTLRGSWEDLRETATMNTLDQRQMLWDDRATFQAKIDRANEVFSAYGTYTYRFQQNKQRAVEVRWHNFAIGGTYVFNDAFNGFLEFAADDYHVEGGAETMQSLDFYFPNSRSLALGINWARDEKLSASASLNHYVSGDVRGTQLTLSLRRRMAADHDLELIVAPWRHEDRQFNVTGYRTTFLSARYTVRF